MADRASIFQQAFEAANTELQSEYQAASAKAAEGGNLVTGTLDAINSVGLGAVKAGYETADFITGLFGGGEPNYEDKDPFRRAVEADAAELDRRSAVNAVVGDISQFATGMLGLGKLMAPIKALQNAGKGVKLGVEIAKGAAVGATVFDPQEERLSNFIESYPELHNPITEYLAASPTDNDAEGRFKSALEGIGLDLAIVGTFAAAMKVFKAVKAGAPKEVVEAAEGELDAAIANQASFEQAYGDLATAQAREANAPTPEASFDAAYGALADRQVHAAKRPANLDDFEGAYYDVDVPSSAGAPSPGAVQEAASGTTYYHGTDADFADFAETPNGIHFTKSREAATQFGERVIAADLDLQNPAGLEEWRAALDEAGGGNPRAEAIRALQAQGFDGVELEAETIVFSPKQVRQRVITDETGETIGSAPAEQPAKGPLEITIVGGPRDPAAPPPPPRSPVDVETEDVGALIEGWKRDAEAIATWGSREAAEANGYRFGQAGQLPWQKLNADGDLQVFTERVAETFKADLDAMKGGDVLSDARVNFMVGQRAWLYGDDPAALVGMLRKAGENAKSMVANMEAGFLVANKALADTHRLASQIRMGSLADFGGDAVAAEKALRQRLRFAVEALGQSKAMSAAAGRSLRRMRGEFRVSEEQLAQLESMDIDRVVSLLYESQGNPKKLAKLADPGWLDRVVRGTGSIMANNLLWGWPSHVVNFTTSVYMSGVRPAERIIGSYFTGGGAAMRRKSLKEYRYMVAAMGDALHGAAQAFKTGDSVLAPHETEWFKAASASIDGSAGANVAGFVPMHTVGDLLKNTFVALDATLRFPTRALGTVDEFLKQTSYRGYVQADAAMRAEELGLKGADFKAYVEKELDMAFDEMNRATNKDALYEAQVRTFSQPLIGRTVGATLQNAVAVHPSLRAIFPFVRTPINVFRYTVKNLPIINLLQKEYREMISGKMGPELQANAVGQMAMGSLALGIAGSLTADGRLTGAGPKEPSLRQALEATGWKAYSLVWENPDGSHTYVPYNRFDPVGLLFGIAADLTEMNLTYPDRMEEGENLAVAAVLAVAKNLSDKTYLQNVTSFMRAAADPQASGPKWLGQLGEGLIPYSSMLRQVNPDPYMREARTAVDAALDRMPGFSDKLPPLRDPFGYPMKVRTGLVFQDNADDIVDAEQMRLIVETGKGIALPTGYKRDGMDLRDMRVVGPDGKETTAWDVLQQLSIQPPGAKHPMKEALAEEIRSKRYGMAPDGDADVPGTKLFLLRRIVSKYREAGFKALLRQYPKEIGEPLARRALAAKEAWRRAKEASTTNANQIDQLREFAGSYGLSVPKQQ